MFISLKQSTQTKYTKYTMREDGREEAAICSLKTPYAPLSIYLVQSTNATLQFEKYTQLQKLKSLKTLLYNSKYIHVHNSTQIPLHNSNVKGKKNTAKIIHRYISLQNCYLDEPIRSKAQEDASIQ